MIKQERIARILEVLTLNDGDEELLIGIPHGFAFRVMFSELQALCRMAQTAEQLQKAFSHYHASRQDGTDICQICGLDLRNGIHKRAAPPQESE